MVQKIGPVMVVTRVTRLAGISQRLLQQVRFMLSAIKQCKGKLLPSSPVIRFHATTVRICALALFFVSAAAAQEPADFFRQYCMACHTIGGGRLTGPDLKDVSERKDSEWLIEFMLNPQEMIDSGDPYALQLQQESRGIVMPVISGLDRAMAEALLEMIEAQSKPESSQAAEHQENQVDEKPFTAQDVAAGKELFLGTKRLANGGPSCLSCHTVTNLGWLSGGRLGPDLTRVYERLGGRRGLSSWLIAPATETMQPVFNEYPLTPEDIHPLVAFFEDSLNQAEPDDYVALLYFFLLAMGGTILGLVFFDVAWKNRFRTVRRLLVHGKGGGE
jgi:cytochrome c2